jgi:hypothetical protein
MTSQRFLTKVVYNQAFPPPMFDPTIPLHPKK